MDRDQPNFYFRPNISNSNVAHSTLHTQQDSPNDGSAAAITPQYQSRSSRVLLSTEETSIFTSESALRGAQTDSHLDAPGKAKKRREIVKGSRFLCPAEGCGRQLKNPSDAEKHKLQHTRPFRCDEPGCLRIEGFATNNDLQRHRKAVHKIRPRVGRESGYICKGCKDAGLGEPAEKWWPRLDNFRAHIKRKHNENWDLIAQSETPRPDELDDLTVEPSYSPKTLSALEGEAYEREASAPQPGPAQGPGDIGVSSNIQFLEERTSQQTRLEDSIDANFYHGYENNELKMPTDRRVDTESDADYQMPFLQSASKLQPDSVERSVQDSGYRSASRSGDVAEGSNNIDDIDDTSSILTDGQESSLPREAKLRLETTFAHELLSDLALSAQEQDTQLEPLIASLPGLLRQFSMLVAAQASNRTEGKAAIFVRHSRLGICSQMRKQIQSDNARSELPGGQDMDFMEKFSQWDMDPSSHEGASLWSHLQDDDDVDALEEYDLSDIPDAPEAKAFLIGTDEYRWLLRRVKLGTQFGTTHFSPLHVSKLLTSMVTQSPSDKGGQQRAQFDCGISWNPYEFLQQQHSHPVDPKFLGSTIVLNGNGVDISATSCRAYVEQMWPTMGPSVLRAIERAAPNDHRDFYFNKEGADIEMRCSPSRIRVSACGPSLALLEAAETLVWLGTACRASSEPDRLTFCSPAIAMPVEGVTEVTFVESPIHAAEIDEVSATCWHHMFRSATIAKGYPAPARTDGESGLEVSQSLLALLSQAPRAVTFAGKLVLKGFNSLVAPVKRVGNSVLWHFLVNKDMTHMMFKSGLKFASLSSFEEAFFEGARHFVGWNASVEFIAGTYCDIYDNISLSKTDEASAGVCLDSTLSISGGKVINVGVKIRRGSKDTPQYLRSGLGTAILHICRAWLSKKYIRYAPTEVAGKIWHPKECISGPDASYGALTYRANRALQLIEQEPGQWWTFQDLVQQMWEMLEQLHERTQLPPNHDSTGINIKRRVVAGFEFKELVKGTSPIWPRSTQLSVEAEDWLKLASTLGCIFIFGSNFDELLRHSQRNLLHQRCGMQAMVPPKHDLLAVPFSVLRNICCKHCQPTSASIHVAGKIYWALPDTCFRACDCGYMPSSRCNATFAKLVRKGGCHDKSSGSETRSIFDQHPTGAIIMGHIPEKLRKDRNFTHKARTPERQQIAATLACRDQATPSPDSGIEQALSHSSGGQSVFDEAYVSGRSSGSMGSQGSTANHESIVTRQEHRGVKRKGVAIENCGRRRWMQ